MQTRRLGAWTLLLVVMFLLQPIIAAYGDESEVSKATIYTCEYSGQLGGWVEYRHDYECKDSGWVLVDGPTGIASCIEGTTYDTLDEAACASERSEPCDESTYEIQYAIARHNCIDQGEDLLSFDCEMVMKNGKRIRTIVDAVCGRD